MGWVMRPSSCSGSLSPEPPLTTAAWRLRGESARRPLGLSAHPQVVLGYSRPITSSAIADTSPSPAVVPKRVRQLQDDSSPLIV